MAGPAGTGGISDRPRSPLGDDGFILHTARLGLRPLLDGDADAMFAVIGDAETMAFYPHAFSREQVAAWIAHSGRLWAGDGMGLWAVVETATGEVLGDCGPSVQMTDRGPEVELGWHVRRDRWGEGIATEAARACRDHVFARTGVDHLISLVRPENVASRRVAEKCGMRVVRRVEWRGMPHDILSLARDEPRPSRD